MCSLRRPSVHLQTPASRKNPDLQEDPVGLPAPQINELPVSILKQYHHLNMGMGSELRNDTDMMDIYIHIYIRLKKQVWVKTSGEHAILQSSAFL